LRTSPGSSTGSQQQKISIVFIDDQPALFAAGKMALEIPFQHPLEFAIDEIRKFVDDILAVQFAPPCWK
jgi:hypothetical protein